jgi:hypothetical protein
MDHSVVSFLAASHLKVSRHCQLLLTRGRLTDARWVVSGACLRNGSPEQCSLGRRPRKVPRTICGASSVCIMPTAQESFVAHHSIHGRRSA